MRTARWMMMFCSFLWGSVATSAEPREITPRQEQATWRPALAAQTLWTDWSELHPSGISTVRQITPEGEAACCAFGENRTLPVNQTLPTHTQAVGVWINADKDVRVRFALRLGDKDITLTGEKLDVPQDASRERRFHPRAMFGPWILWVAGWDEPKNSVLRSISIQDGKSGTVLAGPILAESGARSYHAKLVWKTKSFSDIKEDSAFWCASEYFEYGFDRPAFLRPCSWMHPELARVWFEFSAADGTSLGVWARERESLESALQLPAFPEGTYFIRMSRYAEGRRLIDQRRLVYQVLNTPVISTPTPFSQPPSLCQIDGLKAAGATATAGQPTTLTIRTHPDCLSAATRCRWDIETTTDETIVSGEATLKDGSFRLPITMTMPGPYRLRLHFTSATGDTLFEETRLFGVDAASDVSSPSKSVAEIPSKETGDPIQLSLIGTTYDKSIHWRLPQDSLPALLQAARDGKNHASPLLRWCEYEPVQGIYNDALIERILAMSSTPKLESWIGLTYLSDNMPEWLWYEELMSQDQRTIHNDYHYVSPMGERFMAAQEETFRHLFRRFAHDPRVGGWRFTAGPSEGFLTDSGSLICGYSPSAVKRFQIWLRTEYASLEMLNTAWSAAFTAWDEIRPPYPEWSKPWEDSRAWWDFVRFKEHFVATRLDRLQRLLREEDPVRPALMYAKEGFGSTGALAPVFRNNRIRYSNGGGEMFMAYVQSCVMNNHDVTVTREGAFVMPHIGSVNQVLANAILSGRYGGSNIMWGLVWAKQKHENTPETSAIFRTTRIIDKHLAELRAASPAYPIWAGYYSNITSLLSNRTFRLKENKTMCELDEVGRKTLHLPESWVDDTSEDAALGRFPLLIDCDSTILTEAAARQLTRYVEHGGLLVASLSTGRYQPGHADASDTLMRLLGVGKITEPVAKEWRCDVEGVSVSMQNPRSATWGNNPVVLATATDGTPCMWEVAFGKGRAIVSAGQIKFAKSTDWLLRLISTCGPTPQIRMHSQHVVLGGLLRDGKNWIAVILPISAKNPLNTSVQDIMVESPVEVTLSGAPLQNATMEEWLHGTPATQEGETVTLSCRPGELYLLSIRDE